MSDPVTNAIYNINKKLEEYGRGFYNAPKSDLFEHGKQVGMCHGLLEAVTILRNVLSADEEADDKL